jgi:hypothetical protein
MFFLMSMTEPDSHMRIFVFTLCGCVVVSRVRACVELFRKVDNSRHDVPSKTSVTNGYKPYWLNVRHSQVTQTAAFSGRTEPNGGTLSLYRRLLASYTVLWAACVSRGNHIPCNTCKI